MPILPKEPTVWPEDLFSMDRSSVVDGNRWWVLHTRPRSEKALSRRLFAARIPFFLPLRKKHRGRQVASHLPIFPGYVFLCGSEDDRLAALKTNLVIHCLNVGEQDRLADDLNRVHLLLKSGLPLSSVEQLNPGAEAEITSGPLAGFRGTIVRHGSNSRIVVEVEFLQRGVSVEVDEAIIQPIWHG